MQGQWFAGLTYTWINEFDLRGQNNAWLKSAFRERGIPIQNLNREGMIMSLLVWEEEERRKETK